MDATFQKYTLSNGIRVIVKENHHAQSVFIWGCLPGGANLEPMAGLVSFMSGSMRRGTTKRTFTEINQTIESAAGAIYISSDRHMMKFGAKGLAEDLTLLVELMSDNLLAPTFPPSEIEKLRGQILTGLKEVEDDPHSMAHRHFRKLLYGDSHPYGRPADGFPETIAIISRDDLRNFYARTLHPQGGVIAVVGDVTSEAAYQTLEAALGQWQPPHLPPDTTLPDPQPLAEMTRHVHTMENKSQADLVLGNVGPPRLAADFYAAYVGNIILGQIGLDGRIGAIVRDREGMAYYARTSLGGGLGPTPWITYAGVSPTNLERAVALILEELRRFRQEPVTDQELSDAKAYLTGRMPLKMETNEGVASVLLDMAFYGLGDDYIARYPALINAVTKDEIQAAAQKYLSDEIYALSIAGPYQAT